MKTKIFYDQCFIGIGVVMARNDAIMFFTCLCKRELVPPLVASIMAKFEQIRFGNILKRRF